MAFLLKSVLQVTSGWGLLAILFFIVSGLVYYQISSSVKYPPNLPLACEPQGKRWFSWRTTMRYYTDCAALYREVYEKYTKHGRTVLLPGLGFRNDIIMPQSAMNWVLSRPEDQLSHVEAILEVVQIKQTFGHAKYKADQWPSYLVKTKMNSMLERTCVDLRKELRVSLDRVLGNESEAWTEFNLRQVVRTLVAQAASRFTVGLPLCRNEEYLEDCWELVDAIVLNGGLNGAMPRILRPVLGPIFGRRVHSSINKIKKHFEPIYRQRLQALTQDHKGNAKVSNPPDLVQMMLRFAQEERPDELYDIDSMTRRLCFANFAAMHQTSNLVMNVLLDILGSNTEYDTISSLREEASHVLGDAEGGEDVEWTKFKVARMVRTDSVARETLRLHSYQNRGIFRKVMAKGLVTEDGIELPQGSYISFLGHPLQCDPGTYDDPFHYDPFRFSRAREAGTAVQTGRSNNVTKSELNNLSFVSTSPQHLVFGHGNHSCPGRFLVDFEVKMIISSMLKNYDIQFPQEYGGIRPANRWIAEACIPPEGARIMVKKC